MGTEAVVFRAIVLSANNLPKEKRQDGWYASLIHPNGSVAFSGPIVPTRREAIAAAKAYADSVGGSMIEA